MKTGEPFSIQEMATKYQVTCQTARIDVKGPEGKGLIKIVGKQSNQVLYEYNKSKTQGDSKPEKYSSNLKNTKLTDWNANKT